MYSSPITTSEKNEALLLTIWTAMWARIALPVFVGTSSLICHASPREAYACIETNITIGHLAACAVISCADFVGKAWDMLWGKVAINKKARARI